jgi:hypothetical protein
MRGKVKSPKSRSLLPLLGLACSHLLLISSCDSLSLFSTSSLKYARLGVGESKISTCRTVLRATIRLKKSLHLHQDAARLSASPLGHIERPSSKSTGDSTTNSVHTPNSPSIFTSDSILFRRTQCSRRTVEPSWKLEHRAHSDKNPKFRFESNLPADPQL